MTTPTAPPHAPVTRFEVRPAPGQPDPLGDQLAREAARMGVVVDRIRTARIYLIEADLDEQQQARLTDLLLRNPVTERCTQGAEPPAGRAALIEVHPLPGVMDPAAQAVAESIRELLGADAAVSTGRRFEVEGLDEDRAEGLARRLLANPVIQAVHTRPFHPEQLPRGSTYRLEVRHVPIRDLDDAGLEQLSRQAHLFLSLDEMRAIRDEYQRLGREPTDIELETLAQTWSEHCVHKTLKARIRYHGPAAGDDAIDWQGRPGHTVGPDGEVVIENLLRSTVAAATHELIEDGVDWTLSVFVDNAGIIEFDDQHAVCVKVETHNHPSAIEPYGGAATGIGGCIRDIIGTGLAARPIASTDVFCVGYPDTFAQPGQEPSPDDARRPLPPGCLHPRRILSQVVAGVRDYGNRMGIPTLNGAVWFDDRHVGNPLVFCGCIGVMPRDLIRGEPRQGDLIVALGGRTGRDGIHGATFSSAELTDAHADEFAHAVQIGHPIEQKRLLDAIMRARDEQGGPLFSAITDCGAGGFSSAVGEMGETIGAEVDLDQAPLKYDGLSYTEIWISEAQERMVLAVSPDRIDRLREICTQEGTELAVLGRFGTPDRELILRYKGTEVGRLPMAFLHDGLPTPLREASWPPSARPADEPSPQRPAAAVADHSARLLTLLAHPNIASKHWVIRQYDHEVQGNTLLRPLVGPGGYGPGDAAVIEPVPARAGARRKGLAIGCGLQTPIGDPALDPPGDPYRMAIAAIDECVRNLVCVGADPSRIAILDNFCWPSCGKPENLGGLVRAAEGCYDGAKAYRTPFVSGKDSLNNQFTTEDPQTGRKVTIEIPPTLLISGIGIVPDVDRCVTSDAKAAGNALVLIGTTDERLGGSHLLMAGLGPDKKDAAMPTPDLAVGPANARAVAGLIEKGLVRAAHDCAEGGLLVAAAEMLIGAAGRGPSLGLALDLDPVGASPVAAAFGETPHRYLLEIEASRVEEAAKALGGVPHAVVGSLDTTGRLRVDALAIDTPVDALTAAWRGTLDW